MHTQVGQLGTGTIKKSAVKGVDGTSPVKPRDPSLVRTMPLNPIVVHTLATHYDITQYSHI